MEIPGHFSAEIDSHASQRACNQHDRQRAGDEKRPRRKLFPARNLSPARAENVSMVRMSNSWRDVARSSTTRPCSHVPRYATAACDAPHSLISWADQSPRENRRRLKAANAAHRAVDERLLFAHSGRLNRREADIADSRSAALILVTAGGFHLPVSASDFGP